MGQLQFKNSRGNDAHTELKYGSLVERVVQYVSHGVDGMARRKTLAMTGVGLLWVLAGDKGVNAQAVNPEPTAAGSRNVPTLGSLKSRPDEVTLTGAVESSSANGIKLRVNSFTNYRGKSAAVPGVLREIVFEPGSTLFVVNGVPQSSIPDAIVFKGARSVHVTGKDIEAGGAKKFAARGVQVVTLPAGTSLPVAKAKPAPQPVFPEVPSLLGGVESLFPQNGGLKFKPNQDLNPAFFQERTWTAEDLRAVARCTTEEAIAKTAQSFRDYQKWEVHYKWVGAKDPMWQEFLTSPQQGVKYGAKINKVSIIVPPTFLNLTANTDFSITVNGAPFKGKLCSDKENGNLMLEQLVDLKDLGGLVVEVTSRWVQSNVAPERVTAADITPYSADPLAPAPEITLRRYCSSAVPRLHHSLIPQVQITLDAARDSGFLSPVKLVADNDYALQMKLLKPFSVVKSTDRGDLIDSFKTGAFYCTNFGVGIALCAAPQGLSVWSNRVMLGNTPHVVAVLYSGSLGGGGYYVWDGTRGAWPGSTPARVLQATSESSYSIFMKGSTIVPDRDVVPNRAFRPSTPIYLEGLYNSGNSFIVNGNPIEYHLLKKGPLLKN